METPSALDNGQQAAVRIQRAFRRMQKRIAADEEDLAAILNTLEEAEENRINSREGVMAQVNKTLEGFIGSFALPPKGSEPSLGSQVLSSKVLSKPPPLPSLTSGSIQNLVQGLSKNERIAMVDAIAILKAAAVLFMEGESVCDIKVPEGGRCIVVGDLHGQLRDDLLHIFRANGMPSSKDNIYIFNGDLVDRGDHACEIVLLIFALKLADPSSVYVNRGNHEEPHINIYSGFEEECVGKYDHRVFQLFHATFVWLPFACLVNGKALVLHGGIPSDDSVTLDDLRSLSRGPDVCSEEDNWGKEDWIKDILWSDPHPDPEFRGSQASKRGAGVLWGEDVTWSFLEREKLSVIVRSHQCVPNGVSVSHGGAVYTVFSASNYCGTSGNLGAVIMFGHGADRPTDTYQWDPRKDASMSQTVMSKRKGKEMRRKAAVQQAAEYIVENKTALLEYFKLTDKEGKGTVSFFEWAQGMAQVLQVRMAWNKLVSGLVAPEDMHESCDGVMYEKWLEKFSVELKGGCRDWQDEVVGKITSAVLQSGGDLAKAFESIDTDGSGEISAEEFRVAVRKQLPSLSVLSDAQLEAVVNSFDADGSGEVDTMEFANLLNEHIARAQNNHKTTTETEDGGNGGKGKEANANAGGDNGKGGSGGGGGGGGGERAIIGLQWCTNKASSKSGVFTATGATAGGAGEGGELGQHAMERMLADAISNLFFTHRRELFHIWHSHFDVDGTGSISREDFSTSVRVLDNAGGAGMLSEDAIKRLVEVLDTNGDGRIDFMEFSRNIGSLVERVRGSR